MIFPFKDTASVCVSIAESLLFRSNAKRLELNQGSSLLTMTGAFGVEDDFIQAAIETPMLRHKNKETVRLNIPIIMLPHHDTNA